MKKTKVLSCIVVLVVLMSVMQSSLISSVSAVPIIPNPGVTVDKSSICCGGVIIVTVPVQNLKTETKNICIEIEIKDSAGNTIDSKTKSKSMGPGPYSYFTWKQSFQIKKPCENFGTYTVEVTVKEGTTVHDSDTVTFTVRDCEPKPTPTPTEVKFSGRVTDKAPEGWTGSYWWDVKVDGWISGTMPCDIIRVGFMVLPDLPIGSIDTTIGIGDYIEVYGSGSVDSNEKCHVGLNGESYYIAKAAKEVKFRGEIIADYFWISFYSFDAKIDEILNDPTGNLQEGETVNVYGHRDGPAQVDDVTVGDEVEVFGEYRGYVGAYEQIFLSDLDESSSDHYVKEIEEKKPDLIIQDIYWSPANPKNGDTVTFTVKTKNQGSGSADGFYVCYYVDDSYYDRDYVSSLSAGSTKTTSFSWTAETGSHTIKAIADCYGAISESNEGNNEKSTSISIEIEEEIKFIGTLTAQVMPMGFTKYFFKVDRVLEGSIPVGDEIGVMVYASGVYPPLNNYDPLDIGDKAEVHAVFLKEQGKQYDPWVDREVWCADITGDEKYYVEKISPKTIYVDGDFVDDPAEHKWNTIQEGIIDANEGDTILVYPGPYTENVEIPKSLTIKSTSGNPEDTIVQAAVSNQNYQNVFTVTADNVYIDGFTIKRASYFWCSGIWLNGSHCVISNNTFEDNAIGVWIHPPSLGNNTIRNNNFSSSSGYSPSTAVYLEVSENIFYLNNFMIGIEWSDWSANTWNSPSKITYTYYGSTFTNYLGNYWDDYEEKYPGAKEKDNTGIWDTPYEIDGDKDNYPLVVPWGNYFLEDRINDALTQYKTKVKTFFIDYARAIAESDAKLYNDSGKDYTILVINYYGYKAEPEDEIGNEIPAQFKNAMDSVTLYTSYSNKARMLQLCNFYGEMFSAVNTYMSEEEIKNIFFDYYLGTVSGQQYYFFGEKGFEQILEDYDTKFNLHKQEFLENIKSSDLSEEKINNIVIGIFGATRSIDKYYKLFDNYDELSDAYINDDVTDVQLVRNQENFVVTVPVMLGIYVGAVGTAIISHYGAAYVSSTAAPVLISGVTALKHKIISVNSFSLSDLTDQLATLTSCRGFDIDKNELLMNELFTRKMQIEAYNRANDFHDLINLVDQVEDLNDVEIEELHAPHILSPDPSDPQRMMGRQQGYVRVKNNGIDPIKVDLDIDIKGPYSSEKTVEESPIVLEPRKTKNITFYYSVNLEQLEADGICGVYSVTAQITYKIAFSPLPIGVEVLSPGTFIYAKVPLSIPFEHIVAESTTYFFAYDASDSSIQNLVNCINITEIATNQISEGDEILYDAPVTDDRTVFRLNYHGSDLDIHLYDQYGNHVGVNYNTGQTEAQISGITYSGSDSNPEWIRVERRKGEHFELKIVALSTLGNESFSIHSISIRKVPATLSIKPPKISLTGYEGESITQNIIISEIGGFSAVSNIILKATNIIHENGGYAIKSSNIHFTDNNFDISAGSSTQVLMNVTIPEDVLPGTYTGKIKATAGNAIDESIINIKVLSTSYSIQLHTGWNLISLPLTPEDTDISAVLSPISGNYNIVWAYDASDLDHWKKYDPDAPFGNDLTNMEPGKGYWILMTSDDTLPIRGTVPTSTDIDLKTGWNLIGYNSLNSQPIADALPSITGNYNIVWVYDASDPDHWKKYGPGAPFGNDLTNMEPGKGYWIQMTSDDTLKI